MEQREMLMLWCNNNDSAADFLEMMIDISQDADDLVDEENIYKSDFMVKVLHLCIVDLLGNAFYRSYADWLRPTISNVILMWGGSNRWKQSSKPTDKQWSFVYRDGIEMLVNQVAYLIGGLEHAQNVTLDCHEFFAMQDNESYENWLKKESLSEKKKKQPS